MIKLISSVKGSLANERILRVLRYVFIGGLTTGVSFGVYWILYALGSLDPNLANALSVICAVVFAYITNKKFVFRTVCATTKALYQEMLGFFLSRGITMLIEIGGVFVLYTLLKVEAMLSKILVSVLILILNYILSRFIVFRNT